MKSELLSKIPKLRHGFGTRVEPVPSALEPAWTTSHPSWKQVHGTDFVEVSEPLQKCGEVDALITFKIGIPAAVVTADCVPVLLARASGGAAAAIHAGWRGTFAGTVERVLEMLRARGENLKDWVGVVGPAIGPCCYEVSEELIQDFLKRFPDIPKISPSFRKLDLPGIQDAILKREGLGEVELIRACTQCSGTASDPVFHSYRRDKNQNRQYSGLVLGP